MKLDDIDLHPHAEDFLRRKHATKDWSTATLNIREKSLRCFLNWAAGQDHDFLELASLELENYLIKLKNDGYAPNTLAMRFDTLQMFYHYLTEERDLLEDNPMEGVARSEMMKGTKKHEKTDIVYLTPDEKEQLVEHAPNPKLRNRLLIRLLFQTGVRQSEAVAIKLEDLARAPERSIEIYAPKTDSTRQVYYQESLDWLLQQWLDSGHRASVGPAHESPYLFPSQRAEKLNPGNVGQIVVKAAKRAGIQSVAYTNAAGHPVYRISAHQLRHSHAVHALKSGIDIRWVQEHLGHADISTTEKYLHVLDEDVKEAYHAFDPTTSNRH